MKKLLVVLALVLGIAGLANASLGGLWISVDGVDRGDEITITPSTWITLDVSLDPTTAVMGYDLGVMIAGPGSLDARTVQITDLGHTWMFAPAIVTNTAGELRWSASDFFPPGQTGGKLLDGLLFHCDGPGDVIVTLWAYGAIVDGASINAQVIDTLTIHQPEPMTMLLLGLGGLFLRKR